MKTEVLITIDTEFSIAGAFSDPARCSPLGKMSVEGREHGITFILDVLQEYDVRATFFVEAINRCYFGPSEMGQIARRIHMSGQDIQLHIHPVWAVFDGQNVDKSERFPQNDSLVGRTDSEISAILDIGIESFHTWNLPPPIAIRTGSLMVSEHLYRIFAMHELSISSSVGVGICLPSESRLQVESGKITIGGVCEVPVSTFRDLPMIHPAHKKTLQITSCSWPEIKNVLLKANALGIRRVVVLTHPIEFFKRKDYRHSRVIRNRINQQRLVKLCKFLSRNKQNFEAKTFTESACSMCSEPDRVDPLIVSSSDLHAGMRKLHNRLNDSMWIY